MGKCCVNATFEVGVVTGINRVLTPVLEESRNTALTPYLRPLRAVANASTSTHLGGWFGRGQMSRRRDIWVAVSSANLPTSANFEVPKRVVDDTFSFAMQNKFSPLATGGGLG